MLWTEYRPVIKIGPKGALGSHEIRPIHSAPSLGQSIVSLQPLLFLIFSFIAKMSNIYLKRFEISHKMTEFV